MPISTIGYFRPCSWSTPHRHSTRSTDFLKAAREKPGTINVGTINVGSTQNLTVELFKSMAGTKFVIVPFRGRPMLVVALLRGDVQMDVDFYAAIKPRSTMARCARWRPAVRSARRELPNVPTVQEAGVAGFDVVAWNGLYAPTGTPKEIIDTLNAALHEVLADPALKKRALDLGIDAHASTPAELDARMRGGYRQMGRGDRQGPYSQAVTIPA